MTDAQIAALAKALADQTFHLNVLGYLTTVLVAALIGAAGAYFGSYFRERGRIKAIDARFDAILSQTKSIAHATQSVQSEFSHADWMERERIARLRAKLERLVELSFGTADWVHQIRQELTASGEANSRNEFREVEMIHKLYFADAMPSINDLMNRGRATQIRLLQLAGQSMGRGILPNTARWLDEVYPAADGIFEDSYPGILQAQNEMVLEARAIFERIEGGTRALKASG